ncbi:MAG: hypothetical protein HY695_03465 [Deltaproteobacteria bacterium]|nr:hypothetical protein [Deltaproteobacteria bacterium]
MGLERREEERVTTADVAAASERGRVASDSPAAEKRRPDAELETPQARSAGHENRPTSGTGDERLAPLTSPQEAQDFRSRWDQLQAGFVDEPRRAVEQADELVAQVMKRLAETFSEERTKLEKQWDRGDEVSTEELRVALRRYRSFFQRFLSL